MDQINADKIILAYFDIQAYSSFIDSNSKADCIKKTKDLLNIVKRDLGSFILDIKVKHWIFSDSIIIIPDIVNRPLDISAIDFLIAMSSGLMFRGVRAGLPLRGAVGAGYFYKDNDIIISSALVDAATYEKEQNWYGAVITPSALTLIGEIYPTFENEYKSLLNFGRFLEKGNIPWKESKPKHGRVLAKPDHSFYIKPAMTFPKWRECLPDYIEIDNKVQTSDSLYSDTLSKPTEGYKMKRKYLLASAVSEVPLGVSAGALDLPKWLFRLSDLEYRQCAKGHLGAGVSTPPGGKRTSVNVEIVGGHFAVQHYVEEISKRDHLKLVSERSDVWIFHLIHIHPKVTWEMKLIPTSAQSCIFHHEVSIEHPSVFIKIASILCLVPFFVKRHDAEETKLFAENLARSV